MPKLRLYGGIAAIAVSRHRSRHWSGSRSRPASSAWWSCRSRTVPAGSGTRPEQCRATRCPLLRHFRIACVPRRSAPRRRMPQCHPAVAARRSPSCTPRYRHSGSTVTPNLPRDRLLPRNPACTPAAHRIGRALSTGVPCVGERATTGGCPYLMCPRFVSGLEDSGLRTLSSSYPRIHSFQRAPRRGCRPTTCCRP